jgi:Flp pilus assembly CpaE family ATPase
LRLPVLGSVHLDAQLLAAAHDQGLLARQVQKKSQFMNDVVALADSIDDELEPRGAK